MTISSSLDAILKPKSIAVVGASEDTKKYGGLLYKVLLRHAFAGEVYPINPRRTELLGRTCYPSISALPGPVDLVVLAVARDAVLPAIEECAKKGARGVIVIASKFSDEGPEGAALEAKVVAAARAGGMRLIGPNCLGVVNLANKTVITISQAFDVPDFLSDPIAIASQSGALMATMIDRARTRGLGFAYGVSLGNQGDVDLADVVEFFIDDPKVKVICSYLEGIKNPARFIAVAEKARRSGKPWIMVKAGRTEAGAKAAFSHTGSLAGSYQALEAFCRRFGISLVDDIDTMLLVACTLLRFPKARVRSAVILCTSGGAGSIAADRLAEAGVQLSGFAPSTKAAFAKIYSPGQAGNPVDLGGRLPGRQMAETMVQTIDALAADPAENVVVSMVTTLAGVGPAAKAVARASLSAQKPVISVIMAGPQVDESRAALREAGMPHTDSTDDAIRAVRCLVERTEMAALVAQPFPAKKGVDVDLPAADGALAPDGCERVLSAFGIPLVQQASVTNTAEAVRVAQEIGYPVVLKGIARELVHKSDAGAVVLNLRNEQELAGAMEAMAARLPVTGFLVQKMEQGGAELIVGVTRDVQLGPMLVVGAGGVLVELLRDVVSAVVPLSLDEAKGMLSKLKIAALLGGVRGKPPLDIDAAADVLVKVGDLAHALRERLAELDINPLIVRERGKGCVAVDSRIRLERK